jgi:hypothetical protein
LRFVQWTELSYGFEFQDNFAVHDDIREIAGLEFDIAVSDRQTDLLGERDSGF